jgi:hypothetical protein
MSGVSDHSATRLRETRLLSSVYHRARTNAFQPRQKQLPNNLQKGAAMDEKLVDLFRQWLKAFEVAQGTMSDDFANTHKAVAELEMRIAATRAEGLRGLVVKLGLHQFLSDHADATSLQIDSAYSDLVRLTGHDPARDIYGSGLPISLLLAPAGENLEPEKLRATALRRPAA